MKFIAKKMYYQEYCLDFKEYCKLFIIIIKTCLFIKKFDFVFDQKKKIIYMENDRIVKNQLLSSIIKDLKNDYVLCQLYELDNV